MFRLSVKSANATSFLCCAIACAIPLAHVTAQPSVNRIPPTIEPNPPLRPPPQVPLRPTPLPQEQPEDQRAPQDVPELDQAIELFGVRIEVVDPPGRYPLEEHRAVFDDLLKKRRIRIRELMEHIQKIEKRYRDDGYFLTSVNLPEQEISRTQAQVTVRIVEGYVSATRIEGDAGGLSGRITRYLDKIRGVRPASLANVERYLLLINDIPGVTARSVLRPASDTPGEVELVLQTERKRVDASVSVNNRGSKFTGPVRWSGMVRSNSLLDLGESTELRGLVTSDLVEQRYIRLRHTQLLGSEGISLTASADYGPSKPSAEISNAEVETKSVRLGTRLVYPHIRARSHNLDLALGFDYTSADVDFLGQAFSRDRLSVLYSEARLDFRDPMGGFYTLALTGRLGLPIFGAIDDDDPERSRDEGSAEFGLIQFDASHYRRLPRDLALFISATGQYSFDTLLADEEFRVGGEIHGRGYDPSELAGDHGIAVSSELQFNRPTSVDWIPYYQLYGFYDLGVVWNEDTDVDARDSLTSTGFGMRLNVKRRASVGAEVAFPLTRDVGSRGDRDPRFFFQVSAEF